jgi:hypothetical protein
MMAEQEPAQTANGTKKVGLGLHGGSSHGVLT